MSTSTNTQSAAETSGWWPVFYSAAAWPGVGQWLQGRRRIGLLFGLLFLGALFWLFERWGRMFVAVFLQGLNTGTLPPIAHWGWGTLGPPLRVALGVYLLSLLDTYWVARRSFIPPPLPR